MTTAERIAKIWNASRNEDLNAIAALEIVINTSFGAGKSSLADIARISLHKMEVTYLDGSILTVLDQTASRDAGLTDFSYAFKAQDKAC